MTLKTPGVYIVEKDAFPHSLVAVATAVPAFIGYTQAADNGGHSLTGKPWRISSMAEYERYFGGPPQPRFSIWLLDDKADARAARAAAALTTAETATAVKAAQMDLALAKAAIKAKPAGPDMTQARGQVSVFKSGDKTYVLTRPAGQAGQRFLMHQALRHFFLNGGGPCYVVSVGHYANEIVAGNNSEGLVGGLAPLLKEPEPTMVLVPDAVLLPKADCVAVQKAVLQHCGLEMKNRVAILDVWGGELDRQDPAGNCINDFRNDIGTHFLEWASAYYPWLHTTLHQASDFSYGMIDNPDALVAMVWDELGLSSAKEGDQQAAKQAAQQRALLADPALQKDAVATHRMLPDQTLPAMSRLYTQLREEALALLNLMPPSAAMAGLYTLVDNTRGVWKAPANITVAAVTRPAVAISSADQEDLNSGGLGKNINAIRSFEGKNGTLVWGARTLEGHSFDWRYINVRRTAIMLEQSCRLAVKAMAFEPPVGPTWATLKSMINNFLQDIWTRGGLAGDKPEDAFSVQVGLGETMTHEDILKGVLRVTVLVALSRPAEFTEITFLQPMQKS